MAFSSPFLPTFTHVRTLHLVHFSVFLLLLTHIRIQHVTFQVPDSVPPRRDAGDRRTCQAVQQLGGCSDETSPGVAPPATDVPERTTSGTSDSSVRWLCPDSVRCTDAPRPHLGSQAPNLCFSHPSQMKPSPFNKWANDGMRPS